MNGYEQSTVNGYYQVKLDAFEGPLDLLLHLIKKNKVNIYDIPIAVITQQYLDYLGLMRTLSMEIAGEFLVMASTLTYIKSKMLLPQPEESEEEDPREEIVRPLLELIEIQKAARQLEERPLLDRDVFCRDFVPDEIREKVPESEPVFSVNFFDLIDAFHNLMQDQKVESFMDITLSRVSLTEKIDEILKSLVPGVRVPFFSLFSDQTTRQELILTFLAILEIARLGLTTIRQNEAGGEITLTLR
ncbi:MAG: segregation/condensation protein A [Pseudomonadota bacterium]